MLEKKKGKEGKICQYQCQGRDVKVLVIIWKKYCVKFNLFCKMLVYYLILWGTSDTTVSGVSSDLTTYSGVPQKC